MAARPAANPNEVKSDISQVYVASKLAKNTTDSLSILADYSVWDITAGKFLQPGKDYQPQDLFRT
jgi:hypothetical protein